MGDKATTYGQQSQECLSLLSVSWCSELLFQSAGGRAEPQRRGAGLSSTPATEPPSACPVSLICLYAVRDLTAILK